VEVGGGPRGWRGVPRGREAQQPDGTDGKCAAGRMRCDVLGVESGWEGRAVEHAEIYEPSECRDWGERGEEGVEVVESQGMDLQAGRNMPFELAVAWVWAEGED
jgi:hypothetical protein